MKMKRGKTGKRIKQKTKRKGSLSSDDEQLPVSTSLPPAVEGQLRCFLSVSVSKLTWTVDKHPTDLQIRICWWGEQGQGTVLCPMGGQGKKTVIDSTTKWNSVRYPVCSGPKQFAAYLNDMSTLLLEAIHTSTQIPFGKALISEVTKLTASQPVNVIVPIMSVISPFNKLADIQVYIKFESVSAAYNKLSSSIPTVDTGLDKENVDISNPQPTPPPYLNPATPVSHPRQGAQDPFESPAPTKGVKFSEEPPEQLEYSVEPSLLSLLAQSETSLTQHLNDDDTNKFKSDHMTDTQAISSESRPVSTEREGESNIQTTMNPDTDWIGALLERGQRLREGLAMSTLLDDNTSGSYIEHFNSPDRHVLPGRLFKEILHKDKKTSQRFDLMPKALSPDKVLDGEDKVIDLLMGDQQDFMDNMSILSDVSQEFSELGDPIYDESLLKDLFYKSQHNSSAVSDLEGDSISTELDSTLTNGSLEEDKVKSTRHSSPKPDHKKKKNKKPKIKELTVENEESESSVEQPTVLSDEDGVTSTISAESKDNLVEHLGVDTLTTLGRVNTARVIIDRMELTMDDGPKHGDNQKPRTYFVEYHFPVATVKETHKAAMATEVTRVASKKTHENVVLFNHRTVFPVSFNASILEHWSNIGMTFKIFKRDSGQRQPSMLGVGVFPLKPVLLSSNLSHDIKVDIKEQHGYHDTDSTLSHDSSSPGKRTAILGNLEVKIELAVDGKAVQVPTVPNSQPQPIIPSTTTVSMVSRPVVISSSQPHQHSALSSKPPLPHTSRSPSTVKQLPSQEELCDWLTLHSLLWIQEGKGITLEPHSSHDNQVPGIGGRTNLFLVCRMFWCEEVSKSPVCWGTNHPQFGFKQVSPVLLSPTLLQRTCNNFMVVEVWDKVIPQGEKLVGIVKLPLHQLYLSYRDPKITKTLIKSKFPVVCVDDVLPISNPFTASCHGKLKVLLAMGTEEQISSLLNIKDGNAAGNGDRDGRGRLDNRPSHHLDQQRQSNDNKHNSPSRKPTAIDHHFEITVGDIRGLSIFNSTVWGETDCYIQYHFPNQHQNMDLDTEVVPGLKSHHTPTTLCVPDPSFQDVTHHSFVLPSGTPVQRYLLAAYSGSWTSVSSVPGAGGVPFELWRRYYYPNVRDQLVAKASLPVATLCAMVTMQRQREPSVQTFSLPLMVLPDDKGAVKQDSGLLQITVKYHATRVQPDDGGRRTYDDHVNLSVDVIRACGLKDAAVAHVQSNPTMSYPADVGINAYVIIKLPIGRKKKHMTRTVARTFAPDFSHHLDIIAPFQMSRQSHDQNHNLVSLAEKLEMSEATFELWHQHSRSIGGDISSHGEQNRKHDVLMGVVTIPLSELLICRTGISGWYSIQPVETDKNHDNNTLGGLQLSIKFEDPEDREAVIHTGRSLGWSPPPGIEYDDENQLFDLEDEECDEFPKGLELSLKISRAWVPDLLVQDLHVQSNKDIKGYIRYKLYDKSPLCSKVVKFKTTNKQASILEVKHSKSFFVPATTSLVWYLREERLEAQVWIRGKTRKDKDDGAILPGQRDRLVGSAFINMSSLVVPGLRYSQISGVFPLFKAGADYLGGARIHVQLSLTKANSHQSPHSQNMYEQDELDDTLSSDDYPSTKGFVDNDSTSFKSSSDHQSKDDTVPKTPPRSTTSPPDDSFAAHVTILEAHHLPTMPDRSGDRIPPNVYVSYQVTASSPPIRTPVIKTTTKPVWEFQKLEHLPLSTLKTQNLVFKVWHRPDHQMNHESSNHQEFTKKSISRKSDQSQSDDYCLGFASVDLAPLAAGLRQLIGWYNITDFNGQCKGQIKVGVVPLAPVSPSRCLTRSRLHVSPPFPQTDKPLLSGVSSSVPSSLGSLVVPSQPRPFNEVINTDLGGLRDTTASEQQDLPTSTTSSFLFRQLRQNMQDLDHLQKGLQAKLSGMTTGYYNKQDYPHQHTQDMLSHNPHNPSTAATYATSQSNNGKSYRASSLHCSEQYIPKHTQPDHDIQEETVTENTNQSKPESSLEKREDFGVFERDPTLGSYRDQNQDKVVTSGITENHIIDTEKENIVQEMFMNNKHGQLDTHVENDADKKEITNESDVSHDSDSLEEVSLFDKPYTEDIDSWISNGSEEERKSPVTALAFTLPDKEPYVQQQKHTINDISSTPSSVNAVEGDDPNESEIIEAINLFTEKHRKHVDTDEHLGGSDQLEDLHSASDNELDTSQISPNLWANNNEQGSVPFANQCLKESISNTTQVVNNPSKAKDVTMPNFFMPTKELENSMRALRLGAKLGYPYGLTSSLPQSKLLERTYNQGQDGKEGILNQYSRREVIYKAKQDMQPPLSSIEIDRIARIFSLKDK